MPPKKTSSPSGSPAWQASDVQSVFDWMVKNDVEEFELEQAGVRVRIRRASRHVPVAVQAGAPAVAHVSVPAAASAAPGAAPAEPAAPEEAGLLRVTSPLVGTFYRQANPSAPPFAEVGGRVEKGKTMCIVEAMKVMNEIPAPASGEVVSVMVQNGEPVEFGELLFLIRPE